MSLRRSLSAAVGAVTLVLGMSGVAAAASPSVAAMNPCGFYETSSDAFYNHCTGDGSRVIVEIEVWGPNYEWCLGPGDTWLGAASRIDGAFYTGRTC
ncbi:DUF6355 family natural product biosynthesis protein [Streptomyces sp. NPDC049597]|uniref:DUF6355 family natural product biosynthesis protein n=1 Tax=Streptomyces sp. NPDC049597 TaxID=3155276 RepID=UPI003413B0F1